jgi:hypothetical protein
MEAHAQTNAVAGPAYLTGTPAQFSHETKRAVAAAPTTGDSRTFLVTVLRRFSSDTRLNPTRLQKRNSAKVKASAPKV